MDDNNEYYFTFGVGYPLADFVQQVSAPNAEAARRGMCRFYADRWAFCYGAGECSLLVEGDRVVFPRGSTLQRLPKKIVVRGDKIYTERVTS